MDNDAIARDRASHPRRSVLLQAPAGSGKTTVLTERLLRLLTEVDEPEDILAITFTRKAAGEMRARVLKALRGEIDTSTAQGERMRVFAQAALARARERGWDLSQDPARLRIQTIDSFNFRLATQLTVTAKAGGTLSISEHPGELYNRAARETLAAANEDAQLAEDIELLFERLDNNWGNVQRLLAEMLQQRGHWLRYVLGHEPGALCERVSGSLENIAREQLRSASALIPATLRAEAGRLPSVGTLGSELATLSAWKRLGALTLTEKGRGEWRKPKGINKTLGPEYEHPDARNALRDVIESLGRIAGARRLLIELSYLSTLSSADSAAIEALSRVLRAAAIQLQAQFATTGRVDHTYVAGAAREALWDGGLPTDLALRTGMSLRHILVDEFQDTSLAQFDLIRMLTAGWQEGDGRTLFVVGDPMQSIYQFREAEVGLFLRARDEGIGTVRMEPLRLTRNFRSVPPLIEWINRSFGSLFPAVDDLRSSAVSFTPSAAGRSAAADPAALADQSAPAGRAAAADAAGLAHQLASAGRPAAVREAPAPVRLRFFENGQREAETNSIIDRIAELQAREPEASIAVLVASRSHAAPIMTSLEARGIDAVGVDMVPLRELSIVRDLVALLKGTSHLGDRTAWLAILRAPWCGLPLAALTAISHRKDTKLVWEAIADDSRLAGLRPEDCDRLRRVREVLQIALDSRNSLPLADWLELTWLRLGAGDAYPEREFRHARAFLDALSERVTSGEWTGPQDLDSLLADLFARPSARSGNPVQLMTIHRAKGLEFDHVFIPSLDRALNRGREPLLRWLDLPREAGDSDLIMAPVPAIGEDEGGEVSRYLKKLMAERAGNEQVRLLYVAATRARRSLELSGLLSLKADGSRAPRAGTLLSSLWPALADEASNCVQALPAADSESNDSAPIQRLRRLVSGWTLPEVSRLTGLPHLPISHQSLDPPEFSWVGETARHIGTVVHRALEGFSSAPPLPSAADVQAGREFYLYQLQRQGVPQSALSGAVESVLRALTRTVTTDRGRWIFSPSHRDVHSEWSLTGIAAGRLTNVIIDRSFIDEQGTRWVVDFKTSSHEGGGREAFLDQEMERYRAQLQTYVALVRGIGGAPVRAALYFPLLDAFRELSSEGAGEGEGPAALGVG